MKIEKRTYQPNFQARFIKNSAVLKVTKDEINKGKAEELVKALNDLDKHHRNVALLLTRNENGDTVTNLYNGNKIHYAQQLNSQNIEELNDIKSYKYKQLFVGDHVITDANTTAITKAVANKYFINTAPDYSIGHSVDELR